MSHVQVEVLMRRYLEIEEGDTDITDKEIERCINQAVSTFGTINKVIEVLHDYLEVRS